MSEVRVELDVYFGWCTVRIAGGGDEIEVKAHWLHDSLTDLAEAVRRLLDDTPSVSVVWPRELGGGHFVDFLLDTRGGVSIVVHERAADGRTVDEVFSAERGAVRFRCHVPVSEFVGSFVTALRTVRVRSTDPTGFMTHWPRTFPAGLYEEIERIAVRRYGIKPVPTDDVAPDQRPDGPVRRRPAG